MKQSFNLRVHSCTLSKLCEIDARRVFTLPAPSLFDQVFPFFYVADFPRICHVVRFILLTPYQIRISLLINLIS